MTDTSPLQEDILTALRRVKDPDLGKDIVSLGFVKGLKACGDTTSFTIELTTPACPVKEQMKDEARRAALSVPAIKKVDITMTAAVRHTKSPQKGQLIPHVRNIVPVASGKGGVGKSTVAANLAVALAKLGASVGLADMDVYGPSIPTLMGAMDPPRQEGPRIHPAMAHGVKIISMGFFLPKDKAAVWRGPMLHKTVEQFLGTVEWGELDYLIVDLPPGTGDIQLSLCQIIPVTGAVVVSTPQDVALNIAQKAMLMFDQLRAPILGIVENMSGYVCTHCGTREEILGSGGARKYCAERDIPFLGEVPLSTDIRKTSDDGNPIVTSAPDGPSGKAFFRVAMNIAAQVSVKVVGGAPDGRPRPKQIRQTEHGEVLVVWNDDHQSRYPGRLLRIHCPCAQCVDENTGVKRLQDESVPLDVQPVHLDPVGSYALTFRWSDGHSTGIYTFDSLRKLCPCKECARKTIAT